MKAMIFAMALALLMGAGLAAAQELPKVNVTLLSCTELLCTTQKDVFKVNESAYLDYNTTTQYISYSATITFPDGTKYQTQFPNRVISNVTGNYTIEFTAWKAGYQDTVVTKTIQFVDSQASPASQNPVTINPFPIIAIVIAVIAVLGLWKYSKRSGKKSKH